MIDYQACFQRFEIPPIGVVHIGGFNGNEDTFYKRMGFVNRLFVEAQSDTFATLHTNLQGSGAFCEHVAISESSGSMTFHVAENGQSSSLLPLKKHLDIYPSIVKIRTEVVETVRLDELLGRSPYATMAFNFLNIDIQGAELLALSGSAKTLKSIDIINTEVNFDELYEGAPHIRQLDAFLSAFDFIRVDTVLLHKTWGDAVYVKNRFTKTRDHVDRPETSKSAAADEDPAPGDDVDAVPLAPSLIAPALQERQLATAELLSLSTPEFMTRVMLRRGMHAHDLWARMIDDAAIAIAISGTAEFADKNVAFGDVRDVYQAIELRTHNSPEIVGYIYCTMLGREPTGEEAARWSNEAELAFGAMCSEICWTLEFQSRVRSGLVDGQSLAEKRGELLLYSKTIMLDCYNYSIAKRIAVGYPACDRHRVILGAEHLTVDTVLFGSLQQDADYVVAELARRLPHKSFELRFRSEADVAENGFTANDAEGRATIYLTNNNFLYSHSEAIASRLAEARNVVSGCWLFDNHHQLQISSRISNLFDIVFPAHANGTDYLYGGTAVVGPVVPCGVIQWSRQEAADFYRQVGAVERDDVLYGRFSSYGGRVTARNRFLEAVQAEAYGASVLVLEAAKNDWDWKGPVGRFNDYTKHKVAVSTPILNDIPIRVFDSLLTGQIPIVPFGSLGLEIALPFAMQNSLPVRTYLPNDVRSLERSFRLAIEAFDEEGQKGADRRHQLALDHHMLAHRVIEMICYVVGMGTM